MTDYITQPFSGADLDQPQPLIGRKDVWGSEQSRVGAGANETKE